MGLVKIESVTKEWPEAGGELDEDEEGTGRAVGGGAGGFFLRKKQKVWRGRWPPRTRTLRVMPVPTGICGQTTQHPALVPAPRGQGLRGKS